VLTAAVDVNKLLSTAPDVSVLVSSRSALRISGEQEYAVPPLPLPSPAYALAEVAASDAATLFVARAMGVRPGFRLDEENAATIAEITRRLDGLPLAIELAAARVKLLPVHAIAERLVDTLNFLSAGARDLPDRQRTLRGAIQWSYELLDQSAQRLFARCSVFRGGVELDHLVEVCGPGLDDDVFDLLAELVDQSLLRRLDEASGDVRFVMLETIRDYAAEKLEDSGDGSDTRRRHASVYLRLAEEAAPLLTGEQGGVWLDRLERDHDNLRAVLRHAADDGDTRTGLRLVAALWRMWQIRGHLHEGRRNADLILGLPDVEQHPAELATACEAAGGIAYWQADLATSRRRYTRALELHRELGDRERIAHATYDLAFSYGYAEPERAIELFNEALAAYDALDDEMGRARCHWGLAVGSFWIGDFDAMHGHSELCVPVFRATGQTFDLAWALHMWGLAEATRSNLDAARPLFVEALELFIETDDVSGLYLVLADFAILAETSGEPTRALRLFGAVERLAEVTGAGLFEGQVNLYPRTRRAEDEFDAETIAALRAEGYALSRDEAVAYALER
jgi:predicted ATPase